MLSTARKRHRKSRAGCRTCKSRRVKCDETFPACRRCLRLGQVCDGYGVWGGGGTHFDTKNPSQSAQGVLTATNTVCYGPTSTPGLHVSSEEQLYLDWFIHGTAKTPPRIFNSSFWDPTILQATAHEPMILQALLALSAAHKRHVLDPINRAREGLPVDALELFILKHYGSAIKGLRDHLEEVEKMEKTKWFAAVTMCALLVLVDLMRGRFEEACVHLDTGAHIAKSVTHDPDQPHLSPILSQFFVRLQDQTTLFRRQSSNLRVIKFRASTVATFDLRFRSPAEAGHYLDDLVEQVAHLAQQARNMPRSAKSAIAMHHDICRYLFSCFDSWLNACNATMEDQRLSLIPSDAVAYEALRQRYEVSRKIAETCIGSMIFADIEEVH